MNTDYSIEKLLGKPYWLIDVLPRRVPAGSAGRYFEIEKLFLSQIGSICGKFAAVLTKLNCYQDLLVSRDGEEWSVNLPVDVMVEHLEDSIVTHDPVYILVKPSGALIAFSGDDHYMTLYNPDGELLDLISQLAASEGLFVWQ